MSKNIIDDQLKELLDATPAVAPESWKEVQEATDRLAHDPEYVADVLKTRFVLDILAAMRERKMSQAELARSLGRSRQYVSAILDDEASTNFTIETMTTLAFALGVELDISLGRRDCRRVTFTVHEPMSLPAPEAYKTAINSTVVEIDEAGEEKRLLLAS